jgi:hypothetical protein
MGLQVDWYISTKVPEGLVVSVFRGNSPEYYNFKDIVFPIASTV